MSLFRKKYRCCEHCNYKKPHKFGHSKPCPRQMCEGNMEVEK